MLDRISSKMALSSSTTPNLHALVVKSDAEDWQQIMQLYEEAQLSLLGLAGRDDSQVNACSTVRQP